MTTSLRHEIDAVALGGGRAAADCLGERIHVDVSGAETELPDPLRLLLAAVGGCLLESLEHAAIYLHFRYRHASVRVTAAESPSSRRIARIEYELVLDTDEPPGRVELVHRNLLRAGTVTATLAAACEVEGRVTVREPALL